MNKKEEWCCARLKMKVAVKFFSYISPKDSKVHKFFPKITVKFKCFLPVVLKL